MLNYKRFVSTNSVSYVYKCYCIIADALSELSFLGFFSLEENEYQDQNTYIVVSKIDENRCKQTLASLPCFGGHIGSLILQL